MKKSTTKALASIFSFALAFSNLVGCGGGSIGGGGSGEDANKSYLYLCYFNAGYGDRWLTAAGKRFEEMYKDYSFEDGKVGVKVVPDPVNANDMLSEMANKRSQIYFSELFRLDAALSADVMADITEALTTSLGESYGVDKTGKPLPAYEGETKSVYEKMSAQDKENYVAKVGGEDKMYAVPFIDTYTGTLTYNADIFEKYSLYFKADNTIGAKSTDSLGMGPDGVTGTADDGLPRTYAEFFTLCGEMVSNGVTPFVWAGNYNKYVTEMATAMMASNMGETQLADVLNGSGTLTDYINGDVSSVGAYTTKEETFDSDSAAKIYNTASVFNAIDFIKKISANSDYYISKDVFTGSYSHLNAQGDFFQGKEVAIRDYGFLIDGTWWYNEAEKYILEYEEDALKSRNERNVQYMPLPKANEAEYAAKAGTNVVYGDYPTAIMVKKDLSADQKLLAETFVRFFNTNESLAEYNTIVSNPRRLEYTLTDEQYDGLTPYAKGLYNIHIGAQGYETYKVFHMMSRSDFYRANADRFRQIFWSKTSKGEHKEIVSTFHDYPTLTSVDYFKGVLEAHKN